MTTSIRMLSGMSAHMKASSSSINSSKVDVTAVYSVVDEKAEVRISEVVTCDICLCECPVDEMYLLESCRCCFCKSCIQQYIEVMITDGSIFSITCPARSCKKHGVFGSSEIQKLINANLFDRYQRLRFEREVDLDPSRTFCSRAGCETVCYVSSPTDQAHVAILSPRSRPVQCPACAYLFCAMCKEAWHDKKTCDENMKGDAEGIPFSSADDAMIKRCPICRVPIERNDGCAQMMCKHCKHVFCWYCLTSLDDDFLLRHYDKGKCKNRLGHSRASVIWHRTQVVGIFAGFGILLLVASPFLLLAAPCILCCKCKPCRYGEDDEGDTIPSTTT